MTQKGFLPETRFPDSLANMIPLKSARIPRRPRGRLSYLRRARWFNWVLLAAVVCAVGVFTLGLSCYDDDTAAVPCAICQVTVHSVLEVYTPQFAAVAPVTRVHYLAFVSPQWRVTGRAFVIRNQPRAPPLA